MSVNKRKRMTLSDSDSDSDYSGNSSDSSSSSSSSSGSSSSSSSDSEIGVENRRAPKTPPIPKKRKVCPGAPVRRKFGSRSSERLRDRLKSSRASRHVLGRRYTSSSSDSSSSSDRSYSIRGARAKVKANLRKNSRPYSTKGKKPISRARKRVFVPDSDKPPETLDELIHIGESYAEFVEECLEEGCGVETSGVDYSKIVAALGGLRSINSLVGMDELKRSVVNQVLYFAQGMHDGEMMHTVIMGPPGCGKCLGKGTPVRMFDGTVRKVEEIEEGDLLMGDDSSPRKVMRKCRGEDKLFRVRQEYGDDYIVNGDHILTLRLDSKKTLDVPLKDYLKLSAHEKQRFKGFKARVSREISENLPVHPYLLGLWMGSFRDDGVVFEFHIHSSEVLYRLYNSMEIESGGRCNSVEHVEKDRYTISNDVIRGRILRMGLVENPEIPLEYSTASTHDRHEFIRGVVDGGRGLFEKVVEHESCLGNFMRYCRGVISGKGKHEQSVLTTAIRADPLFYEGLRDICHSLGYRISREEVGSFYVLCINTTPDPDYKIKIVESGKGPSGRGEYFGFELDGNGRFLLGDYTVTHNTTVSRILGEMYASMRIFGETSSTGKFVKASRGDFVGEYLGSTTMKTRRLLKSCVGGVLYIDEAYSLGCGKNDKDSFAKEAMDSLNEFLSDKGSEFMCIISGYENSLRDHFFSMNEGLNRRFPWRFEISSKVTPGILFGIYSYQVGELKGGWSSDVSEEEFSEVVDTKKVKNGGDVSSLILNSKFAHSKRVFMGGDSHPKVLRVQDIKEGMKQYTKHRLRASNGFGGGIPDSVRSLYT